MHEKKPVNYNEIAIIKGYKYSKYAKMTICQKAPAMKYDKLRLSSNKGEKGKVNNEKLSCNLSRTKNTIYELAMCNPWKLFGTFTIDGEKHDRKDLKGYYKKFSQFIKDYNKKYDLHIKYLFVPEKHKDGAWHMHGFIYGLPEDHLIEFKKGDLSKNGKKIKKALWENNYSHWPSYDKKFGFNSFGIIQNHEAISKYMTKYITKDLESSVSDVNAKSFYSSRGLEKATEYIRGYLTIPITDKDCDFVNDFVKIIDLKKEAIPFACDNIIPLEIEKTISTV